MVLLPGAGRNPGCRSVPSVLPSISRPQEGLLQERWNACPSSLFRFLSVLARGPDRLSPAESAGGVFHTKDILASSKRGEGSARAGHEAGEELPALSDEIESASLCRREPIWPPGQGDHLGDSHLFLPLQAKYKGGKALGCLPTFTFRQVGV